MDPEISITIPIYNEEESIEKTVNNLTNVFEKNNALYELVLVNHGSWDNTEKVLEKLSKKNKRLTIFNLAKNLGYGGGIMYGMSHSKGKYIGWTCADEEVSAEDCYKIYETIKKTNYDVVKARRMSRKDGAFRQLTTKVFNGIIKLRFNLPVKDTNGYPFLMKKEIFPSVSAKETTHLFNLDLIRNIKKRKYKILEIPVIHRKRKAGRSFMKLSRIYEMTMDLLRYSI